jgi:DNA-binding response OmpR family regulator
VSTGRDGLSRAVPATTGGPRWRALVAADSRDHHRYRMPGPRQPGFRPDRGGRTSASGLVLDLGATMVVSLTGRVLVVDDEIDLARLIERYLRAAGLEVVVRHNGLEVVAAVREFVPDVVVLDLGLPGIDGIEVCRQVRAFSDCHVLMLTARDDEVDKIVGLSVGADDYVTKPFSPRELVARVQAMVRRAQAGTLTPSTPPEPAGRTHVLGDLVVEEASRQVRVAGEPVALTRIEFDLLAALSAHPARVLSRRQLLEMVWDAQWTGDEHLVDVHIGRIRRKLGEDVTSPRFIHTIRGIGYRMGVGR